MVRALVLTAWTGDLLSPRGRYPQIMDDFGLTSWTDVTGQPVANLTPSPNLYAVEAVCSDDVFEAILAHPDYGEGAVLWHEQTA